MGLFAMCGALLTAPAAGGLFSSQERMSALDETDCFHLLNKPWGLLVAEEGAEARVLETCIQMLLFLLLAWVPKSISNQTYPCKTEYHCPRCFWEMHRCGMKEVMYLRHQICHLYS
jgi:hypothetical protein